MGRAKVWLLTMKLDMLSVGKSESDLETCVCVCVLSRVHSFLVLAEH